MNNNNNLAKTKAAIEKKKAEEVVDKRNANTPKRVYYERSRRNLSFSAHFTHSLPPRTPPCARTSTQTRDTPDTRTGHTQATTAWAHVDKMLYEQRNEINSHHLFIFLTFRFRLLPFFVSFLLSPSREKRVLSHGHNALDKKIKSDHFMIKSTYFWWPIDFAVAVRANRRAYR